MKKFVIAAALLLSASGFAAAESNHLFGGNYAANVVSQYDTAGVVSSNPVGVSDRFETASIIAPDAQATGNYAANITMQDLYGR